MPSIIMLKREVHIEKKGKQMFDGGDFAKLETLSLYIRSIAQSV
jgi:hypothetical protein